MRPEILFDYFKSVTSLKGVGPALANTLHRIMASHLPSLPTVRDLLFYPPTQIIDRRFSPPLFSAPENTVCTFEVTVDAHISAGSRMRHASKKPHRVQCSNDSGDLMLVFFHGNADWIKKSLPEGQKRIVSGRTEKFDFRLQMTHPDIIAPVSQKDKVMVVEPQYPLTQGLSNKKLRELISNALSNVPQLPEWYAKMPTAFSEPITFQKALKQIHNPANEEDLATDTPHYIRLVYDELVAEQLLLHEAREKIAVQAGIILNSPRLRGDTGGRPLKNPDQYGAKDDTRRDLFIMERAKDLRKNMTDAEYKLWHILSGKKLGGYKFRRQQAIGDYIVDFVQMQQKLVIEIDGGQHDEKVSKQDLAKERFLKKEGFDVLRFWNHEVMENIEGVAEKILQCLPPSPPVNGGGFDIWQSLQATLPFTLTQSQQEVLADISVGLASGKRYIRLLQGDVGSGKTIIALFAILRAVENDYQAALMVPTEIVAQQHYYKLKALCEPLGVHVVYLTGSVKGAERKAALADIEQGRAQIVIGTHALFQDKVIFHKLALVVIDEQHRFGVDQRMALVNKGDKPHILHMTATPIPRSLMMTYYGDMQPLYLKEKPAGRLPIDTRVIPLSRADELLERLQAALDRQEKIYWICPQIDASEQKDLIEIDIAAAQLRYTEFATRFGADKVALIHGRMPKTEQDMTMKKFARGEVKMIVATTVIEVGVDVPDATIMVIESAERFGMSQLHQLRGRVGRGDKQSYCILLYKDTADELARTRLATLKEHEDGFAIADMDLELRGGGELMGRRQSGAKTYFFARPEHMKLLPDAFKTAKEIAGSLEAEILKELFI